jgi:hypothetical protein
MIVGRTESFQLSRLVVLAVSAYLMLVGIWLLLTRQIPSPGFGRILLAQARRPYRGEITNSRPESGHCFLASVPRHILSDRESASRLTLFENGRTLGPAHCSHDEIRRLGKGRFSHWGDQIYFSASDNSDPRKNGRRYSVEEVRK